MLAINLAIRPFAISTTSRYLRFGLIRAALTTDAALRGTPLLIHQ